MSPQKQFATKEAKGIGTALGIDWRSVDVEQFRIGLDVELEHGSRCPTTDVTHDDPLLTGKIALAHLNKIPDYYSRLVEMEEEAVRYHNMMVRVRLVEAQTRAEYAALGRSLQAKLKPLATKSKELWEAIRANLRRVYKLLVSKSL